MYVLTLYNSMSFNKVPGILSQTLWNFDAYANWMKEEKTKKVTIMYRVHQGQTTIPVKMFD